MIEYTNLMRMMTRRSKRKDRKEIHDMVESHTLEKNMHTQIQRERETESTGMEKR